MFHFIIALIFSGFAIYYGIQGDFYMSTLMILVGFSNLIVFELHEIKKEIKKGRFSE